MLACHNVDTKGGINMKKYLISMVLILMVLSGCNAMKPEDQTLLQKDANITLKEAKDIALTHAALAQDNVNFEVEEMVDGEPSYYLLVIKAPDKNFVYKVEVTSGKILLSSHEESDADIADMLETLVKPKDDPSSSNPDEPVSNQPTEKEPEPSKPNQKPANPAPDQPQDNKTETDPREIKNVTRDLALQIALKDAGLSQSAINRLEIERDREHNIDVFEVEFIHGDYKYEYDIAIADGKLIKKEIEYRFKVTGDGEISMAHAKELALARVVGANENHISIKKDYDDGRIEYEGRIIYDGYEYEFEIDGHTGIFLEWEMKLLYR